MRVHLRTLVRVHGRLLGILVLCILLSAGIISYFGFYPIGVVNGDWILARQFYIRLQAAERYEDQAREATSTKNSTLKNADLATSVLEGLVEERLVAAGAKKEFEGRLSSLKAQRIESFFEDREAVRQEAERYGISSEQFRSEVLEPQVVRDLFAGRLFLQSMRLEDWLKEQKHNASVSFFSNIFLWEDGTVRIR